MAWAPDRETELETWQGEETEGDMQNQGKNDTVAFNTIGTDPSAPLAYDPGL